MSIRGIKINKVKLANALIECRRSEAKNRKIFERASFLVSKFGDKNEYGSPYYLNKDFIDYADGSFLSFHHIEKIEEFSVSWGTHLVFKTRKGEIVHYRPYASWIRALNKLTETEFETPEWEDAPEELPRLNMPWDLDLRSVLYPFEMLERI